MLHTICYPPTGRQVFHMNFVAGVGFEPTTFWLPAYRQAGEPDELPWRSILNIKKTKY